MRTGSALQHTVTMAAAVCLRGCAPLPAAIQLAGQISGVSNTWPQGWRVWVGLPRLQSLSCPGRFLCGSRSMSVLAGLRCQSWMAGRDGGVGRHLTTRAGATRVEEAPVDVTAQDPPPPGMKDPRVPVTIITGFLGAGKTTLLNHVLTAEHGKRIAVIENEYGEVDIDGSLVAAKQQGEDEIIMLNNGCLCCTVRGDLVRMLGDLLKKKRDKFDHILIETTGLANPAPIIQTFYLEEHLAHHLRLDGVVTLVDAKHATQHIEEVKPDGVVNEAVEQIAYADRIILNKIDLVKEADVDSLIQRIQRINGLARVQCTKLAKVEMDYVLGVGGFDLDKVESDILAEEASKNASSEHGDDHEHDHVHTEDCGCSQDTGKEQSHKEHNHSHAHDHTHDPGVSSVSIVCGGALDLDKINTWLESLMNERSEDLYRTKGVLTIDGWDERFIFQGVHSLLEGSPDRNWGPEEKRINKIVFIGKNLDEAVLRQGFQECLVPST